jgi:hypothetical protein
MEGINHPYPVKQHRYRTLLNVFNNCGGSAAGRREDNHVSFVNHHFYTSTGNHHHRDTEQCASGFQVLHLDLSAVHYGLDCLFVYHGGNDRGNPDLAEAGKKIPSCKEHE